MEIGNAGHDRDELDGVDGQAARRELVGEDPFGGFNMSGTDSKAGGADYLLLFTQAKSVAEKLR